jgi:serine/threonine-protein phosphatase 2A regulatory subunit B''
LEVWRRGAGKESQPPASDAKVTVAGVQLAASDARLGLPVEQFAAVAKTLCGFPSFFAAPLFRRIASAFGRCRFEDGEASSAGGPSPKSYPLPLHPPHRPVVTTADEVAPTPGESAVRETSGEVQLYQFLRFWRYEVEPYDHYDRFLRLVSQRGAAVLPSKRYLTYRALVPTDFMPLMEELLAFHPGLAFLENTPEFQEKYARTVIGRVFFKLDPTARQCITSRALRQSDLLHAFHTVDMEEDINLVNEYFSYEHFYVLYCKFWELDADHDFFLSREDLSKVSDLTQVALDRVFEQAGRPFTSDQQDRMAYEDFIAFLMSEEDKTAPEAIRYWFGVVDLDGDGILSPEDMRVFYTEQHARMQELRMEAVAFQDLMTQKTDLLKPDRPSHFELKDFLDPTRVKLTGVLFSCLFNISKFQAFEARDAVLVKQQLNNEGISQWDRFASVEYMRLAEEEEGGIEDNMSFDVEGAASDGRW